MPWTNRGQYCAYCTSYLSYGNLSRHLETCARFDGRFSVDRAKEALELEQKHKAKYTTKYVLSRSEVYNILGEFVGHKFTTFFYFFLLSLILLNVHRDLPVLGISIHGYSVLVSHGGRAGDMGNNNIVS